MSQTPTRSDFRREVKRLIDEAREAGAEYVDIVSSDVHTNVGGYPAQDGNHRMPMCCEAMYDYKKRIDEILFSTQSGKSSTLKIRYYT